MAIKTNLFRGDRVKLSKRFINMLDIISDSGGTPKKLRERVGTITTKTLSVNARFLWVHWDGNKAAHDHDLYTPEDLVLYEEETTITEFVRSPYQLQIRFKSNQFPWRGTHDAYKIYTDEEAIEWARSMQQGMGSMYDITLVRTDNDWNVVEVIQFETQEAY